MNKALDILSKLLIFFGLGLLLYATYNYYKGDNFENYSKFGDSIGGLIGTLWSLAGILLFYLALTEQRKDIKINQETLKNQIKSLDLQIEEYKLQRIELEETRKVLKNQSETLQIQQFESTFFNMLHLLQEIINELKITVDNQSGNGRDFFKVAFINLKKFVTQHNTPINDPKEAIKKEALLELIMTKEKNPYGTLNESELNEIKLKTIEIYEDFYNYYHNTLGHYFRFLFNIMKFTITSNLTVDEKSQYINLIQAQMSSYELGLVFYNALSKHGNRMFDWLEQYKFLENIDSKALLSPLLHSRFYPTTKFKFIEINQTLSFK
jgi:hypothetical protein